MLIFEILQYKTLGVADNSTLKQIKAAYYEQSKLHHPDMSSHPDAAKKFQKITEAYEILGNSFKRKEYDEQLKGGGARYGPPGAGGDYDPFRPRSPFRGAQGPLNVDDLRNFEEFQKFWRRRNQNQAEGAPRGRTDHYDYDAWFRHHYGAGDWNERNQDGMSERRKEWIRRRMQEQIRTNQIISPEMNSFVQIFAVFLLFGFLSAVLTDLLQSNEKRNRFSDKDAFWAQKDLRKPFSEQ